MFYGNAILTIFLAFSGVGGAGDGADSIHAEIIDTLKKKPFENVTVNDESIDSSKK